MQAPGVAQSLVPHSQNLQDIPIAKRPQLLDYPRLHPDWIDWQIWAARVQMDALQTWATTPRRTYAQSIDQAINGQGVAFGNLDMLASELETGQLVQISDAVLTGKDGYYLTYPVRARPDGNTRRLMNFLLDNAPTPLRGNGDIVDQAYPGQTGRRQQARGF